MVFWWSIFARRAPSLQGVRDASGSTMFPWEPVAHRGMHLRPEIGKPYFLEIEDRDRNRACVQGVWIGTKENRKPGALRVLRLVDAWNPVDPFRLRVPEIPLTIEVPPSRLDLESVHLIPSVWRAASPSRLGLKGWSGSKPAPSMPVCFVMEEGAPGNAVYLMAGTVLRETPENWHLDEGLPDRERVLVRWEKVLRVISGGKDAPMPPTFVVPVECLISF